MISLIWAQDIKGGIGIDNLLPWNIKEEMEHFRNVTRDQIVVMGQKTFESIGKPLKNRVNIVISDDLNFNNPEVKIYRNIPQLLEDYKNQHIYIIGGKSIYEFFASMADELIVSKINQDYHCNRFLNVDFTNFTLTKSVPHTNFVSEWWTRKQ